MDACDTRRTKSLDAAWKRRRALYIGCARKLASQPEIYSEVRRFLERAMASDSESRKQNALEWHALLAGRDAGAVSEMILNWLVPDPGRGSNCGEMDRLLSNCPLAAIADDQIRSNAGFAPEKQPVLV